MVCIVPVHHGLLKTTIIEADIYSIVYKDMLTNNDGT